MPALEVLARSRDQVAHVDRLARLGVGHEADRRRLVLQIEEGGDEARGAREGRMAGDVAHPIVAHPDPAVVLQAPEKVLTPACRHAYRTPSATLVSIALDYTSAAARERLHLRGGGCFHGKTTLTFLA